MGAGVPPGRVKMGVEFMEVNVSVPPEDESAPPRSGEVAFFIGRRKVRRLI